MRSSRGSDRLALTALLVGSLAFMALAAWGDWYERLSAVLRRYEAFRLDEVLLGLLVLAVGFAVLSVRRWSLLARHIEERDRAERALEDERGFSDTVLDTVSSLVLVLDRQGRIVRFNHCCEQVSGHPAREVAGRPYWDLLVPEDDREGERAAFARLVAAGVGSTDESRWRSRDGSIRRIEWTHTVTPDRDGRAIYVVATGRDVTDERAAQERIRATERKLQGILDSIDDFVWSQDAATREMIFLSPSVEAIFGITPDAMRANTRTWLSVVHRDDREKAETFIPSLTGAGRADMEYRIVRADGTTRWIHDRAWSVTDEAGRVVRYDGIARDVTAAKALEEQFRQSQKMEAVGLLAGGIAHDFNNLLTAIGGYAELLVARLPEGDPRRPQAEAIQKSGARAAGLTRQLLAFSRRQVLQPKVFGLNALLGEIGPMIRRLIGEDVALVVDLAPALGDVRADAGQIEQVLMNLVVNARDAMPQGGTITLRTDNAERPGAVGGDVDVAPGSYVSLSVIDTGEGMTDSVRARIFEPFFTTKPVGKGTGLGLSTVYGIVRQSGGHIEVESRPGCGATFRVLLPRHEGAAIPEPPVTAPSASADARGETILLVEDEHALLELARDVLEEAGYRVLAAGDGREAIPLATRHADEIDLVLSDVVMPGLGGFELADRLASVVPGVPVLFMSGYSQTLVRQEGRHVPRSALVEKPFTPAALVRRVREALDAVSTSR